MSRDVLQLPSSVVKLSPCLLPYVTPHSSVPKSFIIQDIQQFLLGHLFRWLFGEGVHC